MDCVIASRLFAIALLGIKITRDFLRQSQGYFAKHPKHNKFTSVANQTDCGLGLFAIAL
ncbi:hypothetical protein QUB80_08200 [Chlorogloeopsis sp. ULAP01]|uniref:hypothetical protein n=1 Tax=Chlorogloeopsis sp. ULAP01 TaxID=3056483 RepID=UPI0025AA7C8A|nr:hypothetical protein [Chlorogloeopsis sp. ULAP01]MDM9380686.1 hypothetical protein [Chlorogloeopsis sp. ULAP01]